MTADAAPESAGGALTRVSSRVTPARMKRSQRVGGLMRLRELRERSRLSQREVGLLIGIKHVQVWRHETGATRIPIDVLKAYAQIYKVDPVDLFYAENVPDGGTQ